jgi:stage III sporulation protein AE
MTAALAAQGGSTTATALYTATAFFDAILCRAITSILLPLVAVYWILSAVGIASGDALLCKLRDMIKQVMSWGLKLLLYVFTAYMSISGLISGTADQTAIKAAKLTISGMVPVAGGILADASESVLVGAGIVKNSVGIYGLIGVLAITLVPFLTIGIQYVLLKCTAMLGSAFAPKALSDLLADYSTAMGFVLALTGSVCVIQLISIVCFIRGMT